MTRGHDEGSIYRRKSDGRWVAALPWGDGRKKYRYRKTRREAVTALIELHALRRAGRPLPDDSLTVGGYLDRWMKRRVSKLTPETQRSYEHEVKTYIRPGLGKAKLLTLNVEQVAAWVDGLIDNGVPPATAKYCLLILRACLQWAMREDIIVRNPAALVPAPKYRARRGRPLSAREATGLLGSVREHRLFPLVVLALTSGLRRGELLGLTWGAVHEQDGYLEVRQQAQRQKGRGIVFVPTKTERSAAPVVVTRVFLRTLGPHRQRLLEERVKAGPLWRGPANPVAQDSLVFPSHLGTPMEPGNVWREWKGWLRQAGIEHRRLHDTRHTTATMLRALGVEAEVVQAVLRHTRWQTTAGYVHTDLEQQRAAAAAMDELLGGVLG